MPYKDYAIRHMPFKACALSTEYHFCFTRFYFSFFSYETVGLFTRLQLQLQYCSIVSCFCFLLKIRFFGVRTLCSSCDGPHKLFSAPLVYRSPQACFCSEASCGRGFWAHPKVGVAFFCSISRMRVLLMFFVQDYVI